MNRTGRLYALVEELRAAAPRPRSAKELARRFEVSTRTIERDLLALQEASVPVWSTPGPGGGYTLDPAHTLPPVNLTSAEAAAIVLALSGAAGQPFAAAARTAYHKVLAGMEHDGAAQVRDLAGRVRRIGGRLEPGGVPAAVEEGVLRREVIEIDYSDSDGLLTRRSVEPYGFLANDRRWYLLGWCRLREGGRGFRLDRITAARLTGEAAPRRDFEDLGGDVVNLARKPALLDESPT